MFGQQPRSIGQKVMGALWSMAKLPIVLVAIVVAAVGSYLLFWLVVRAAMYIHHEWLSKPWY